MTPYHPLTSTGAPPDDAAMIWPWPHNWGSQVTRRAEWSTVVLPSATGAEQRQALREYPREQVTYEHLLEGDDAALALGLLAAWKGKEWLVPDWTEATTVTAPAGAVLEIARDSVGAGMALLGTEVVTLLDASGTLDVAPSGSWPAGTVVVPLRLAALDDDQTVSQITGAVSRISPTFLFEDTRPVDETVLTRVAQPASVIEVLEGVTIVPGQYGGAVKAVGIALTRLSHFRIEPNHTLEFWIKWPHPGARYENVIRATQSSAYVDANIRDGSLSLQWLHPFSTSDLRQGEWTHVAVTRDSNWSLRFFVDGHMLETQTDFYQTVVSDMGTIEMFTSSPPGRTAFSGALDDVRMTHACRYTSNFTPSPCLVGEADPYWSDVAFLLNGEVSRWGITAGDDPRARRLPMAHNWVGGAEVTVAREVDVLDPGVGLRHTRPVRDLGTTSWALSVLLDGPDDIAGFRAFLQQHRGSAISMYAAPPGADVVVTSVSGRDVTSPMGRFWDPDAPPFPFLALLTSSGWTYLAVERATAGGLLLVGDAGSYPEGSVLAARGVHRARILGDAVEIQYHTPGAAEVSLPLVTVAQ